MATAAGQHGYAKKFIVLILLTIACNSVFAQADSIHVWNKWCSRRDTPLLFVGGNNVIEIHSPTIKATDLKVKSLDKSLRIGRGEVKADTVEIMAMPYPAKGKNMRLAIMNKNKIVKTIYFSSDTIPKVAARMGTITATEAPKKDILQQNAIRAYFPRSLYSYPYSIKQYTFHINTDSVKATITVPGFFIPKDVLLDIKNAPVGTVVNFTDIKVTCPDCIMRTTEDFRLKIK